MIWLAGKPVVAGWEATAPAKLLEVGLASPSQASDLAALTHPTSANMASIYAAMAALLQERLLLGH